MTYAMIIQCLLGAVLGLWLHFLKKAREQERAGSPRVTVLGYIRSDVKESLIAVIIAFILIVGLPELTEVAQQVAGQMFGLTLPPLQRSFFLCAILGGFGNSLADIAGTYFGGARLKKFAEKP